MKIAIISCYEEGEANSEYTKALEFKALEHNVEILRLPFDIIGDMPCFQFDMSNYMELAEKLKTLPHKERVEKNREKFLNDYSISENVKSYIEG